MRKPFIQTLTALAEKDPKVLLLIGDVGFSFLEEYRERFPKQFINMGIAEQNMMGVAAGLAVSGMKPYVYTMTNFILLRPLEQLRNDIVFANANVKLFGVKGGPSYKFLGMSHNMTDLETGGILTGLHEKGLRIYIPKEESEVEPAMRKEYETPGPAYFQI